VVAGDELPTGSTGATESVTKNVLSGVVATRAVSRHAASTLDFQCPEADWTYCYEEFDACDSNCDPWDSYHNCQQCRDSLDYCINGQPSTGTIIEETNVSYTGTLDIYCDLHGGGNYGRRTYYVHHVEYQPYYCAVSGWYYYPIDDHYFYRACFHYLGPDGCPPNGILFDKDDYDCRY
jgi:hypothetical protein